MKPLQDNQAAHVSFEYDGQSMTFFSVGGDDYILNNMRRRRCFYESDVLERIRERVQSRKGGAIDGGAFIGTHGIYFAKFCGLNPVLAFEANPNAYRVLERNIAANRLEGSVIPARRALGSARGFAVVDDGLEMNRSAATVSFAESVDGANVEVTTIDSEVLKSPDLEDVALIKIDVEGAELEVLKGALVTIGAYKPVLCIEVHTLRNLRFVTSLLPHYWIIDCLGYSPTYILEPVPVSFPRKALVHALWFARTFFIGRDSKLAARCRWYLRRAALASSDAPTKRM